MKTQLIIVVIIAILIVTLYIIQRKRVAEQNRLFNLKTNYMQQEKINSYNQQIVEKEQFINNNENEEQRLYELHELYYNGIPDKYDSNGNKIKGIKPDPHKAIKYLKDACRYGNPNLWMKLASIYKNGMYNLDPDLDVAMEYYTYILNNYPQYQDIVLNAEEQLNNIEREKAEIYTYKWLNLPRPKRVNAHHEKIKKQWNNTTTPFQRTQQNNNNIEPHNLFRADNNDTFFLIDENELALNQALFNDLDTIRNGNEHVIITNPDDRRYNDMHNTHNSQVVSTIARSLKKMKDTTTINTNGAECLKQIRSYIETLPDCDKKRDAFKSLNSIEKNFIPVSSVDMKEIDVLNLVWNRINNSPQHGRHRDELKNILYNQLADMQEHGKSVCSTGRLTRIVDTLNTFDKEVEIKPTYVINQEMMNKAAKIRSDLLDEYEKEHGKSQRQQIEIGTATNQQAFDQQLKDKILQTLKEDYVDTEIMTENKFDAEVGKWIDAI